MLERGCVAVLELKGALHASQAAIDQAMGYARDLRAYHAACADRSVTPALLVRGGGPTPVECDGVYVVGPEGLDALLEALSADGAPIVDAEEFLALDAYAPSPTIVQAARELFHRRELPMIERARAATDPALRYIADIAREAARTRTRHLVLLSGVPGSGKTLVGLQLVHAHWLDEMSVPRANGRMMPPAVYLSGNGPLVQVLQHALQDAGGGGRTFVQAIKEYVRQHSRPGRPVPPEHLIVFDEAQRAHDAERVAHVHGSEVGLSEPERLIEFCERIPEWCVLVALIGNGQAIHVGALVPARALRGCTLRPLRDRRVVEGQVAAEARRGQHLPDDEAVAGRALVQRRPLGFAVVLPLADGGDRVLVAGARARLRAARVGVRPAVDRWRMVDRVRRHEPAAAEGPAVGAQERLSGAAHARAGRNGGVRAAGAEDGRDVRAAAGGGDAGASAGRRQVTRHHSPRTNVAATKRSIKGTTNACHRKCDFIRSEPARLPTVWLIRMGPGFERPKAALSALD